MSRIHSLKHSYFLSSPARLGLVLVLLMVFFSCPMVCGFLSLFMEWLAGFFG